ncbi:MAG: MFS transporter [Gammaproteobacteria bacterium CG22_combo_CG10-13_8_21_14_all_40_8]|nr:MAG: MFS transporter [Gammaproteobacteria bacterium CG22_combo_CG10-13_8_21_14_all_40_8]
MNADKAPVAPKVFLPRAVIVLSLVSFLNDSASEMITPLLPLFLTATLGAGPMIIGFIEGLAEATASFLKFYSGRLADKGWPAKKLVLSGYSLSNFSRPLIGFALGWPFVLMMRFFDRIGKGIRSSPRDAIISSSTDTANRGKAFGFQRALDNLGAMVGPLLAYILLSYQVQLQQVFFMSVIPGALVLLLLWFGLPASARVQVPKKSMTLPKWSQLDAHFKGLLVASAGLALATAPEVFLILWATDKGLILSFVPLVWAAASTGKALISIPAGQLSDKLGRKPILVLGWSLRVVTLLLLAYYPVSNHLIWVFFLSYSASLGLTEGAERALIGDFAPEDFKASAFGLYHMTNGLFALPGALLFGTVWQWYGGSNAFVMAALLTLSSIVLLSIMTASSKLPTSNGNPK